MQSDSRYYTHEDLQNQAYSTGYDDGRENMIRRRWRFGNPLNQKFYEMGWEDAQADNVLLSHW